MIHDLKNKIISNTIINGGMRVLVAITGFISVPIFLKYLGATQYGLFLYLQIFSTIGIVGLFDLGLKSAMVKYIAEYKTENNREKEKSIIFSSYLLLIIISLIVFAFGFNSIDLIIGYLKIPSEFRLEFKQGLIFVLISTIIILPANVCAGALEGHLLYKMIRVFEFTTLFIFYFFSFYFLYKGLGFLTIIKVYILCNIFKSLLYLIYTNKYYTNVKFRFSIKNQMKIIGFSNRMFFTNIINTITINLEKFIIAYFFTPAMMSYYEIMLKIPKTLKGIFSLTDNVIVPISSEINIAAKEKISNLFVRGMRIKFILLIPIILFFLFNIQFILNLWISAEFTFLAPYICLLLLWNLFTPFANYGWLILVGMNKNMNQFMVYSFFSNFLKILFLTLFIDQINLFAVPLSYLTFLLMIPYSLYIQKKNINFKVLYLFSKFFKMLLICLPSYAIFTVINQYLNLSSLLLQSTLMIMPILISGLMIYRYYLDAYERNIIFEFLKFRN